MTAFVLFRESSPGLFSLMSAVFGAIIGSFLGVVAEPLALIDGRHLLLPDCLTQPLLWAGLLVHLISPTLPLRDAIIGAVAGYLSLWLVYWTFRLITGREGLGYGVFKLLAALGAWCGWQALPDVLLLASLTGIAGHLLFIKADQKAAHIPFGPALAAGGVITLILQNYSLIP